MDEYKNTKKEYPDDDLLPVNRHKSIVNEHNEEDSNAGTECSSTERS